MWSRVFLVLVLPGSVLAGTRCQVWPTSTVVMGKAISRKIEACWDGGDFFRSRNCHQSRNCVALKKLDLLKWIEKDPRPVKGFGTLGFHLCHELKGKPEIIKLHEENGVRTVDRCVFEADHSFVETSALALHWRSLKK